MQFGSRPARQAPVKGSQISAPLQKLPSLQSTAGPAQRPFPHTSGPVHGFPSSHGSVRFVWRHPTVASQKSPVQSLPSSHEGGVPGTHCPLAGLQVSTPSHASWLLQSIGVPAQTPTAHVSLLVQRFPSLHGAVLSAWKQPRLGLQRSSVHGLLSSQVGAGPPTQNPVVGSQVSAPLQGLLSSQDTDGV